jgi:homoaconitate hydratase family protein/3-isopropylmalate dehydratase small subunit
MDRKQTFAERILGAPQGAIVFRSPDIVLSHDNTASIRKTFQKMGGSRVYDPGRLMIVLDHNAPPATAQLANDYQGIRDFVHEQGVSRFYDAGRGICHQLMSRHARPGMIIAGSDSHTCTAGAFNTLAVGIDRTETAGLWKREETWFRVPESMKIILSGHLPRGVYAKDLSLWIIGKIGSEGANYLSMEFHGEGVRSLGISDRMTLANLASEMGAKNAVFPPDETLSEFYGGQMTGGVWADEGADYIKVLDIDLDDVVPLVAAPHHVDNIKTVAEVAGTSVQEGLIGTCTNGRIEDLRVAAEILEGKTITPDFQLTVIPASADIYLQAVEEGIISTLIRSGANVLSASCGACLGTGQGIPADGHAVISTANRNFIGRMGNEKSRIYLASPATVAASALAGNLSFPPGFRPGKNVSFPDRKAGATIVIPEGENRRAGNVWNYADIDNLNTDQMFAGNLTYKILSSDAAAILPHLFKGFDTHFAEAARQEDLIIAGDNFGCGSSREHPAVGLANLGIRAVIVKSVNRIFFRSAINQGLPLIVHKEAVENYTRGDMVTVDFGKGVITVAGKEYCFTPLPGKLQEILREKGLVNWILKSGT